MDMDQLKTQALGLYSTASGKASELYGVASAKVVDVLPPQAVEMYGAAEPYLAQIERDEYVLIIGTAVLPALCLALTLLYRIFCCCCLKKKAEKIAPAPPPPPAPPPKKGGSPPRPPKSKAASATPAPAPAEPPPLVTRKSVIVRGQKDAPPGSVGHATRGLAVKNPKPTKQGAYMA